MNKTTMSESTQTHLDTLFSCTVSASSTSSANASNNNAKTVKNLVDTLIFNQLFIKIAEDHFCDDEATKKIMKLMKAREYLRHRLVENEDNKDLAEVIIESINVIKEKVGTLISSHPKYLGIVEYAIKIRDHTEELFKTHGIKYTRVSIDEFMPEHIDLDQYALHAVNTKLKEKWNMILIREKRLI